jgi:hypothetical protein
MAAAFGAGKDRNGSILETADLQRRQQLARLPGELSRSAQLSQLSRRGVARSY